MRSPSSSPTEDDDQESSYYWWRSAAGFDQYVKLKFDVTDIPSLNPRLRVIRELERLALVAPQGLNELRHKLLTYQAGDFWVPIGGICKENMEIPSTITVLLVGLSGSGKSSLVNLMYSVLGRAGLVPFSQTSSGNRSNYTTMALEEHNVLRSQRSGFCVYDSRGFNCGHLDDGSQQLSSWMNDGVRHNQICLRPSDNLLMKEEMEELLLRSSSNFVKRRVNCVMVVANIAEIYKASKGGDSKPLEATRAIFCSSALKKCNENPILILTHGDMLTTEERIEGRLRVCEYLGISETSGVYDIVCLSEYGLIAEESDPVTAYALAEALYRALLMSDRHHSPRRKLQEQALVGLSWLLQLIGVFFALLAEIFSKLGQNWIN